MSKETLLFHVKNILKMKVLILSYLQLVNLWMTLYCRYNRDKEIMSSNMLTISLLWNHFLTWQWRISGCISPHSVRWLGNTCLAARHPLRPLSFCSVGPAPLHPPASSVSLSVGINILYSISKFINLSIFINARCTCLSKLSTGNKKFLKLVLQILKSRWFAKL